MACDMRVSVSTDMVMLNISGIAENEQKAIALVKDYIANVKGDDTILAALKQDMLKARADAKLSQGSNFSALRTYITYGEDAVKAMTLSNDRLNGITSDEHSAAHTRSVTLCTPHSLLRPHRHGADQEDDNRGRTSG